MISNYSQIEFYEKNGKVKIIIDGNRIKGITRYEIKRDTDIVELTLNISVPMVNFKTIEN